MKRLIKHKWLLRDGFRVHQCEHCGVIREWDNVRGHLVYRRNSLSDIIVFSVPECIGMNGKKYSQT
jgi:hypothetical protein